MFLVKVANTSVGEKNKKNEWSIGRLTETKTAAMQSEEARAVGLNSFAVPTARPSATETRVVAAP